MVILDFYSNFGSSTGEKLGVPFKVNGKGTNSDTSFRGFSHNYNFHWLSAKVVNQCRLFIEKIGLSFFRKENYLII